MTVRETILELIAAWKANDALRASAFFAPDGSYVESGRAPVTGRAAVAEHFTRFFRDGPPWRVEVDDLLVEGPLAAVRFRFGVKGEAAWKERAGCAWVRLREGLIEEWHEYHG